MHHFILGILQGLSEFLPISSSGHLHIYRLLCGIENTDLFYDVVLHAGTMLAVIFYFRKDLLAMAGSLLRIKEKGLKEAYRIDADLRMLVYVVIGTIPIVFAGLLLLPVLEKYSSTALILAAYLVTTALLFLSRLFSDRQGTVLDLGLVLPLVCGLAQCLALVPGVSRSGITIVTAMIIGAGRETAGKFSFLLSLPAICGALVLTGRKVDFSTLPGEMLSAYVIGFISSLIAGFLALKLLLKLLKGGKLYYFGIYTALVAAFLMLYLQI